MRQFGFGILALCLVGAVVFGLTYPHVKSPQPEPKDTIDSPLVFDGSHPWFVDITKESGLKFVHDPGEVGKYFMPEQVGSGAAFFDFNKDGYLDIYLLQNGGPKGPKNCLYQQAPDGTFHDVSKGSGLDIPGYNMGVAIGDVNNDGWPDVLVTQYDGVKLFLNNGAHGAPTFADVTEASGLNNPAWGTSAAFFDYDRDGWLDLVVVSYVDYDPTWPCSSPTGQRDYCAPKTFKGRVSRLFHNRGIRKGNPANPSVVTFEDVTEFSGLGQVPGPGLGVACADFDGDRWPDIFIANDGAPNRLWINQKNGRFKEEAVQRGVAYNGMAQAQAGMGVALGDIDGDGLFDLFVTHLSEETHTFWKQGPPGDFQDRTVRSKVTSSAWRGTGFGTLLVDFDHDGALDLAIANGRVYARPTSDWSLGPFWSHYGDRNQLFRGDGKGHFQDVSLENPAFSERYNMGRGLVRGDINKDGAQDLLVTSIGGPARLFRNVAAKQGHWLEVKAFDPILKRDAYGAEVRVRANGRTWVAWFHPAEGYLCSSEPIAHFGLGQATQVDAIEVLWPDGSPSELFPGSGVDRRIVLNKGGGKSTPK